MVGLCADRAHEAHVQSRDDHAQVRPCHFEKKQFWLPRNACASVFPLTLCALWTELR